MEGCVWKNNKLDDALSALSPKAPFCFGDDGAFFWGAMYICCFNYSVKEYISIYNTILFDAMLTRYVKDSNFLFHPQKVKRSRMKFGAQQKK